MTGHAPGAGMDSLGILVEELTASASVLVKVSEAGPVAG